MWRRAVMTSRGGARGERAGGRLVRVSRRGAGGANGAAGEKAAVLMAGGKTEVGVGRGRRGEELEKGR